MTFFDVLAGLCSLLALAVGVTVLGAIVKGGWLVLVRAVQAIGRFMAGLLRNPAQAAHDAPFLIQLLILPFLLAWERVDKWRHPEEARRKQALVKRSEQAAQVFQSRLGQVAQNREAVQQALAGLKAYVDAQTDGAWLQTLPEALGAEVNIMSMYALPGYPDADEKIQFEERRGGCVMWVAMHPNPWRIQFLHGHLLRWWAGQRLVPEGGKP